ncbi:MAG: ArnT family glycosyltransferase [Desulfobulbaceae bacterium]
MPGNCLKAHRWWLLLWAALVGIALFTRPPLPIDETRYLSVAWEMWQGNQFLVPHSNGVAYSHKPPLLFWLIHFGWWLFGVNAWTARLVPPLFGLGAVFLSVRIGRIFWPEDEEMPGTLPFFLLGMIFWSMYATLTMFDMLVTFFCLSAFLGLLQAWQGRGVRSWLLAGLAVGLGLLAKGPVVLLYIMPPALLAPWWGCGQGISWRRWYGGLLLALAGGIILALAWALPAARAGGPEYAQAILMDQTAGRVLRSFAHARPFFWYAFWLPLLLFPWIFWGPVWRGLQRLRLDPGSRFCLSALIPPFLLLSSISGKQVHYLLPLLPAAALLMARAASRGSRASSADLRPVAVILIVVAVVVLALPHLHLQGGDADMLALLPPWLGTIPLFVGLFFLFLRAGSIPHLIIRVAVMNVLMLVLLHLALSAPLRRLYDQSEIGAALQAAEKGGKVVAVYPTWLKDQLQFAGRLRRPLLPLDTLEEEVRWAMENPGQYCLVMTTEEGSAWLRGNGAAGRFKDGWLIVRPAAGLHGDYLQWKTAQPPREATSTSPPG